MRHLIAVVILIGMGIFFGFDELFRVMGFKSDDYGIPTCRNKHIMDMLAYDYVNQLLRENPSLDMADARHLRNGTRIRFSGFKERGGSEKENRIYCKADFKAENVMEYLYFRSNGSVEYDIHLVSREKIESIPKRQRQKWAQFEEAKYEHMGTKVLIEDVYIKWNTAKFERE